MTLRETKRQSPVLREGRHWRVDQITGCWEWQLGRYRGYGRCIAGQAHRIVWCQSGRPLDASLDLHHRCGNKGCVNPEHLEPVSRSAHLKRHRRDLSRLAEGDVAAIRSADETQQALASRYGVSRSAIKHIRSGRHWKDVAAA